MTYDNIPPLRDEGVADNVLNPHPLGSEGATDNINPHPLGNEGAIPIFLLGMYISDVGGEVGRVG